VIPVDEGDELPVPRNPAEAVWSEALLMDLVLGVPDDVVCETYQLQHHQLAALRRNELFNQQLTAMRGEMQKTGVTFKAKARAQADALLDTSWQLIHNPATASSVKADLIKSVVRWAGYDNPAPVTTAQGNGFQLVINLGGAVPQPGRVIEGDE
jgi:hypothetical protein